MYCPILRSKQFELIALRELMEGGKLDLGYFCPIIEPVRSNITPLIKTIKVLNEHGIEPLVIINPSVGDFLGKHKVLIDQLELEDEIRFVPSIIVKDAKSIDLSDYSISVGDEFAIVAFGGVDRELIKLSQEAVYTVVENSKTNPLALSRLKGVILYEDAFKKKIRNLDYEEESPFSYLHATYNQTANVVGFGDYTTLPKEYMEGGGPAYVVTIHISYINRDEFDEMYVRHYSSYSDGTPTNPQGKFLDALDKLISDYRSEGNVFDQTSGMDEFERIYDSNHYPGLGQVKKISMKHHIETICDYLAMEGLAGE
ncbi:sce7725 family protein [Marinimicrobium locisalis]|uniref:sce7725 family protein n=1 Tax=Marinimicrobium locisalis TaxID=546022 RepID=UPI0032213BF3